MKTKNKKRTKQEEQELQDLQAYAEQMNKYKNLTIEQSQDILTRTQVQDNKQIIC